MKKSRLLGAVRACVFASTFLSGTALAATVDAFDRGWYSDSGFHDDANIYTVTGDADGNTYNSFFTFDLSAISGTVTSGTLRLELELYLSPDASEAFSIYDVTTDVNILNQHCSNCIGTFNDLQSGAIYGAGAVSASDVNTVIDITLSSLAIADINTASGELFAVGVSLDELFSTGNEAIRWSAGREYRTHQLVLNTSSVPIPGAVWLFGSGLIGLIGVARRKEA